MTQEEKKILLIGYGNPARGDDGLGPALARAVAARNLPGVQVETGFQLAVEDVLEMAGRDEVIFADASVDGPEPFFFRPQEAEPGEETFTTHHFRPGSLVALAVELFDVRPRTWVLGIRGYDFEMFKEELSPKAERNLEEALSFLLPFLEGGRGPGKGGAFQTFTGEKR